LTVGYVALFSVRVEGHLGVVPYVEQPHDVVHGKVVGGIADDVRVCVGQAIGDIRPEEETHIGPAIRELRPSSVESCSAPVDDATDTAAMPENVARMEVPVREDALGGERRQTGCDGADCGCGQGIVFSRCGVPRLDRRGWRERTCGPVQHRFV